MNFTRFNIFFLLLMSSNLIAVAKDHFFAKFPNEFFVETGLYIGDGVEQALLASFDSIRSIELSEHYFLEGVEKFKHQPNVKLFLGDSGKILFDVISDISVPITFWLDGHYSGANTARGDTFTPIIQELNQIAMHPIKSHTIIIDDIRLLGQRDFDYITLDEIKNKLKKINPSYKFVLFDGYCKNDILVAYIDTEN